MFHFVTEVNQFLVECKVSFNLTDFNTQHYYDYYCLKIFLLKQALL